MAAAIALGRRGLGTTGANPAVGCIIVRDGRVVGRGWTQPGGRPHAEAVALAQALDAARGATAYVTLEPCAHRSERGPACAAALAEAGVARVVAALTDPDPRTSGGGFDLLRAAGVEVAAGTGEGDAREALGGFLTRQTLGRPRVTLKLATSLDGRIALATGESRWITGDVARAHAHRVRAEMDAILVGRGTFETDAPRLDVRLPGVERPPPRRLVLTRRPLPGGAAGWERLESVDQLRTLVEVNDLLVEGGAGAAAAFGAADCVDRLLLYRAPLLIGGDGAAALGAIGLANLSAAHGRWRLVEARNLGDDRMELYERRADLGANGCSLAS